MGWSLGKSGKWWKDCFANVSQVATFARMVFLLDVLEADGGGVFEGWRELAVQHMVSPGTEDSKTSRLHRDPKTQRTTPIESEKNIRCLIALDKLAW